MKMFITETCGVRYDEDSLITHTEYGSQVEVSKDQAAKLVAAGRALYVNQADDPAKGRNTASAEMLKAAAREAAAAAKG